ncbi:sugar phosphate isomerase/epimerase [Flavobacterium circumlabens]|uniref:Sugar phosphate isomerase/epimerase n=1 Tax=Flavobacterium circumlabens TaxID=2133765 RepID=A0A4Y7UG84_9FLAO|nr:sugar phosphate isomerase/epimerase [Flavobacterium circumlabens]TCN59558.1 sugar phosphate isomerase/epimerase [Flavobacterium circumlabens]TEB45394.1 sugar phosphate isomerase/epimerase [Flavobacterium circumlabens]
MEKSNSSRRTFVKNSGLFLAGALLAPNIFSASATTMDLVKSKVKVNGHLWLYASKYPPNWDSTPNLEAAFADMSAAGLDGIELMDINLTHDDSVKNIKHLIDKYDFPVSGTSYGVGPQMWDKNQHDFIIKDVTQSLKRLSQLKGKTFGISVGEANRLKTEAELDAQAEVLKKIFAISKEEGIEANLHNHTYEVENGMHDLKGTLARIPDINLGPDLNWLIRAGINPIDFIKQYGDNIVYMHLRDQYSDGTWTEYLGQGATDFKAIANALKAIPFKGSNVAIELAFPKDFQPVNPLKEDWKLSREYVKNTFGW